MSGIFSYFCSNVYYFNITFVKRRKGMCLPLLTFFKQQNTSEIGKFCQQCNGKK